MRRLPLAAGIAAGTALVALALTASRPVSASKTRTYYVAADEVVWDFAPSGTNQVSGRPFDAVERSFVEAGPRWVGATTLKALYREYTDSTFSTLKPRAPAWAHLGFLGP